MQDKTVVIIGGGPAGMMASAKAAENADKVVLIEKNPFLGKKLRITGKGRCNITNSAPIEDFFENVPTNGKFLYSAFYSFTNEDAIKMFEGLGVKTKTERGGRVFPESDSAKDVAEAMKKNALKPNVKLIKAEVKKILQEDGKVTGVKTEKGTIKADSVILATGGKSYPLTGSDGSGYALASDLGHTIVEPKPSLIPITTVEKWPKEVMGLTLKNVRLTVYNKKGKDIYSDFGEMVFTHFGISGPIVLSASAHMRNIRTENYSVKIDLKPALDSQQLDKRICRDFEKYSRKQLSNALDELLPKALIPIVIAQSGIAKDRPVNSITKEERQAIVSVLKGLELTVSGFRPIDEAIITSGGIKTSEINPSTMESKLVSNLFFAGEVIDVDAYTGGFNLQIAFSTGYLAGENA